MKQIELHASLVLILVSILQANGFLPLTLQERIVLSQSPVVSLFSISPSSSQSSSKEYSEEVGSPVHVKQPSRRSFIESIIACKILEFIISCQKVNALDDIEYDESSNLIRRNYIPPKKPFAPLSALLPAARVKLTIDDALILTNEILQIDNRMQRSTNNDSNINNELAMMKNERLMRLQQLILEREKRGFMQPFSAGSNTNNMLKATMTNTRMPSSNTKLYDETYKQKLKDLPVTNIPLAILSQAGDKRQFGILQRRQRILEKDSPIRQALNFYTRQIQFNTESYVLNVNSEEKKKMIRNDTLPDIKSVIVSDLDLRDLVRNQILDAYDDVRAELQLQIRNDESHEEDDFDASELQLLLIRAQKECNRWFDFIDDMDVQEAMIAISSE